MQLEKQAPLVTRDQGDFIELDTLLDHYGILVDKQLHLRDRKLVAHTISSINEKHRDHLNNNIIFISNFYGRF